MKKFVLLISLILFCNMVFSQKNWFTLYKDSVALVKDGNEISDRFISDIKKIKPEIVLNTKTILHTTPYWIYYDKGTVNLPLWDQVTADQQKIFYAMAGDEAAGKAIFGLFFNGFYLPHELGHALQHVHEGKVEGSYKNEHFANIVAILWWRKSGREKELKQCYEMARLMFSKLPNPTPSGVTMEDYFTQNYRKATQDPVIYGYMQFKQFIEIYEDKTLPDFDTYISTYLKKK